MIKKLLILIAVAGLFSGCYAFYTAGAGTKKLEIGMTLKQATKVMRLDYIVISANSSGKVIGYDEGDFVYKLYFVDNVLTEWHREYNPHWSHSHSSQDNPPQPSN